MKRDGEENVHMSCPEERSGPVVQEESDRTQECHNRSAKTAEWLDEIEKEKASPQRKRRREPEEAVVEQIVLAPEEEPPPAVSLPVQTAEYVLQGPERTDCRAVDPAKGHRHNQHQEEADGTCPDAGEDLDDCRDEFSRCESVHRPRG